MGRYYQLSNGTGGKFWFGIQPTSDFQDFGGYEQEQLHWEWSDDDIPFILKQLRKLCKNLKATGFSYRKCVMGSFTHPPEFSQAIAAKICLGVKILRGIKDNGGYLSGTAEY